MSKITVTLNVADTDIEGQRVSTMEARKRIEGALEFGTTIDSLEGAGITIDSYSVEES